MKKRILSIVLTGLVALSLSACGKNNTKQSTQSTSTATKVVRLGYPGAANFIGGIAGLAQEKKFFEEELSKIGYKVEYTPFAAAGPAVNEALAGNKIDLAIYADFPGVVLKSKGIGIDLLGIPESKFYSQIVVKNDSEINSVKDLKGKKIGFTKGTYMHKNLIEILAKNGLSTKDVELINVTTDAESALLAGNIDALVQTETSALLLTTTKKVARSIDTTRNYPEFTAQVVFVGVNSYVKANPDVPVAINKALLRAKDYFKNNTEESYIVLTKSGLNLESVRAEYGKEAPNFDLFTVGITEESIKKLEETQKFLLSEGLIKNAFDITKWAQNSYYEKAIK